MQKVVLILFLMFLVLGIYINAPLIIADRNGDGSGNNSGSDSNSITDNSGSSDDDNETEIENEADDNDENETEDEERVRIRIKEERRFIDEDGREVKIERKIKIKDGEVEIRTKLKVEGRGANLSIVDSEGERHIVRVTPERLRTLIMESLGADNITGFSLDEIKHKNIPRIVYKVNSEHPGRFLGIFKLAIKAETQIDPETGEIIDINVPWWVFLITGDEISNTDEIIGNETLEEEIVADDDELEEEFGDIEIDEELEINVETLNGSSEIKVELEFDTATSNTNDVISEVLSKLTLSSEEINSLLEMGESDEPLETEEKLEAEIEIESEDGLTEVEFEWRFIVNSDNREEIVNAVITKLSELTAEDINNVLEDEEEEEPTAENAQQSIDDARAAITEAESALTSAPKGLDFSAVEQKIADAKMKLAEALALFDDGEFAAVIDKAEDAEQLAEDAVDALENVLEDIEEEEDLEDETNSTLTNLSTKF